MPTDAEVSGALTEAASRLAQLPELPDGMSAVPNERCDPNGFRRVQSLVFGFETFAELFNVRQRYVLSYLSSAVREAHQAMLDEGFETEYAATLATYLGLAVDRLADYDSSFCGWTRVLEGPKHVSYVRPSR